MNKIKKYFREWDFSRYFRLILGVILLIAYFSTLENLYLVGSIFLTIQAVLNIGCPGGACTTAQNKTNQEQVMKFEKLKINKDKKNV